MVLKRVAYAWCRSTGTGVANRAVIYSCTTAGRLSCWHLPAVLLRNPPAPFLLSGATRGRRSSLKVRFRGTISVVENEVLSLDEAAVWLKVDAVTVRRLLREGRLPGRKTDARQWRISADDLKAYVERDQKPKVD